MASANIAKYAFIDALRGWAILGVVLVHTHQWLPATSDSLRSIAQRGSLGVQLFFMTSALTLFLSLHSRFRWEKNPFKAFFIRRFFRIAPLFYLAVAFYLWKDGLQPRFWAPDGLSLREIVSTITFTNGWHPTTINSVVPGGWSIALEMSFYCFVPLFFLIFSNIRKSVIGLFFFLAVGFGITLVMKKVLSPLWSEYSPELIRSFFFMWLPSQLAIFCMGFALYFILNMIDKKTLSQRSYAYFALFLSISFMYIFSDFYGRHVFYGVAFMLFACALKIYPHLIFVNRLVCSLGTLSFSVYLSHFAVISGFEEIGLAHFLGRFFSGDAKTLAGLLCVLTASAMVSKLTYEAVERPGIRLGTRIIKQLGYSDHHAVNRQGSGPAVVGSVQ